MLATERHSEILRLLHERHVLRVADLARELGVSEVTIRRDFDTLAKENLVTKVHGGATLGPANGGPTLRSTSGGGLLATAPGAMRNQQLTSPGVPSARQPNTSSGHPAPTLARNDETAAPPISAIEEPGFEAKRHRQEAEKHAIAREAIKLIKPGFSIGLTAGTTTWTLAHMLRDFPDITVVTNSPAIARALAPTASATDESVLLTGGARTPSDALVGPLAVRALENFNLDIVFLGVHGMHHESGFTTPNLLEAETNRAFIKAASNTVVLADHTKWETPGLARIGGVDIADILITDTHLPPAATDALSDALARTGGELITTPGES